MESSLTIKVTFPLISPNNTNRLVTKWAASTSIRKGMVRCGGLKKELEEIEKEGKEWIEMENCKEKVNKGGMVELVECLEKEAIMGDDQGREPSDYNRRARIFDKSSKVFQDLKLHAKDH